MKKEKTKRDKILIIVGKILLAILAFAIVYVAAQILPNTWINRFVFALPAGIALFFALPASIKSKKWLVAVEGFGSYFLMVFIFEMFQRI